MTDHADVVVIGGGVVGASTAFHLAQMKAGSVTLLERTHLAAGATGKSGAVVRMHYSNPHDATLAQESLHYFQRWGDIVGVGDPGFVKCGMVRIVESQHIEALKANIEMLQRCGVDTYLVNPDEIRAIEPMIHIDESEMAAYEVESGYADPVATTRGFANRAADLGAEIRTSTPVLRILTEGDAVRGVETPDGVISCQSVVLAAGAWANDLLHPLGLDYGLRSNRVQVVIVRRQEDTLRTHPVIVDGGKAMWIRPERGFGTLAGYDRDVLGVDPSFYLEGVDMDYALEAHRRLATRLPSLANASLRGGWAGVITMSPDGYAIIDQIPEISGLYCALGDSGTNFKTAPAIGKGLAEWVMDGAPRSVDFSAFRSTRFRDGVTVSGGIPYGEGSLNVFR
jgi:sarcosine oxidase, subunit beta